ncbi:DNA-binding protein HU [Spirochaetia bacterium]|nr:DNA-binding protein HU [Spirochaetia bacterium]
MSVTKFTKAEIVDSVFENIEMSRYDIKFVVDSVFDVIKDALVNGMVIELRGFGTFQVRIRKGRKNARNPRTGEEVTAPPHGIASFRPGKELKEAVWELRPKQVKELHALEKSDKATAKKKKIEDE